MNDEVTLAILAFIAFAVPIVGALWKIFAVREHLQSQIQENKYRLGLIETHLETLSDKNLLAFNGLREVAEHVRTRSAREEEKLDERLIDVECYLEKTTSFQRRRS